MAGNDYKRNINKETKSNDGSLASQLSENQTDQAKLKIEEGLLIEKGMSSSNPSDILTANKVINGDSQKRNKPKSFVFDPYALADSLGYKDKPLRVSYNVLRNMAKQPIIKSIVGTRREQVASYAEPQDDTNRLGWKIVKKRKALFRDLTDKVTDDEKREMEKIADFILNCGIDGKKWDKDPFPQFLRKITQDSLEIDQMTFEVPQTRGGRPYQFFATDGATMRLADSYINDNPKPNQIQVDGYYPYYVQLYEGLVRAEYYPWELAFGIRNTSTNIRNNGYGTAELEDMVRIVTWMIYGDTYNGKFFSQGASPKGIIKVAGNVDEDKLAEFRNHWRAQVAGVENAWRVPIIESETMDWIDLQKSNRDMEFSSWQEYLIRLSCSLYKIDPKEIGFDLSAGGGEGGNTTYEGNQEYKLQFSQEKGLVPLLKFIGRHVNSHIVYPLTGSKYEFIWTGIEEDLEDATLEGDVKKLEAGILSWKDIRKKYNLPDVLDADDFLLNPVWLQFQQMKMQGGDDSNEFVDGQFGGDSVKNPFDVGGNMFMQGETKAKGNDIQQLLNEERQKGQKDNPFVAELNAFTKGLMGNWKK